MPPKKLGVALGRMDGGQRFGPSGQITETVRCGRIGMRLAENALLFDATYQVFILGNASELFHTDS